MPASSYIAGTDVPVQVVIPTYNGSPVTATGVSWAVSDEAGNELHSDPAAALPAIGDTTYSITIPAAQNALAAGALRGARAVEATFATAHGDFKATVYYVLIDELPLVKMQNSFLTFPEALMRRTEMGRLDGWDSSQVTDAQRTAALISAWLNMTNLRFRYPIGPYSQSRIADFWGTETIDGRIYGLVLDIRYYTLQDFVTWPEPFQVALQRAQLAEADNLLTGDPVGDKRRAGIVSETIGESSMFFKDIPPVSYGVSREALEQLRGYLYKSTRIMRG